MGLLDAVVCSWTMEYVSNSQWHAERDRSWHKEEEVMGTALNARRRPKTSTRDDGRESSRLTILPLAGHFEEEVVDVSICLRRRQS